MEPDAHHGITRDIPAWRPSDAGVSLGTAGVWRLPSDHEGTHIHIIALACPPLMEIGPKGRADHVGLMRGVGGDEAFGIDIAAVEQVRAGEEVTRDSVG
jgi:hypothetical protein